jgi:hypothetical protein
VSGCATVPAARWIDWWRGEVDGASLDALEEHLLACDRCTAAVDRLAVVVEGLAAIVDKSSLRPVLSADQLDALVARSRVAVFRLRPGDVMTAEITAETEIVVARFAAPLRGLIGLDVEFRGADDQLYFAIADVEFTPDEVIIACQRHVAISVPSFHLCLIGIDGAGRREIARATLVHHIT